MTVFRAFPDVAAEGVSAAKDQNEREDMSDDAIPSEPSVEPDIQISGDPFLNLILHLAEQGASAGLTVYSGGLAFSGALLSTKQFYEKNIEFCGGPEKGMGKIFDSVLANHEPFDEDGDVPNYRYVHMNGRTHAPGHTGMPENGALIRIARSDIIGWSMGTFTNPNKA